MNSPEPDATHFDIAHEPQEGSDTLNSDSPDEEFAVGSDFEPSNGDKADTIDKPDTTDESDRSDKGPGSIDAVAAERDAYRETLQRVQADFENYRKRMLKQQSEQIERAAEGMVTKLLPVLDTVELALAHEPNGSLEQVKTALVDALTKGGLERIVALDEPFNPTLHEAVAHEPGNEAGDGEPRVSEELRAGYRWKGRVVRPTMVKVAG